MPSPPDSRIRGFIVSGVARLRGDGTNAVLARGGLGSFLVSGVGAALAVLLQLVLSHQLSVDGFGRYIYALNLVSTLAALCVLGFETASLRFVASYRGTMQWGLLRGYLRRSAQIPVIGSLCVAAGIVGATSMLRGQFAPELGRVLRLSALLLPVLVLLRVASSHLQGLKRVVVGQVVQQLVRGVLLIAALAIIGWLLRRQLTASGAMILNISVSLVCLAMVWRLRRRLLPNELSNAPMTFETGFWIRASAPLFLISAAQTTLIQVDTLLLGAMTNTTQAGIYAVASQFAIIPAFAINAANSIVAPMIAEFHAQGRRDDLQRMLILNARGVLLFAGPAIVALIFGGRFLLGYYGPAFVVGWAPMVVLSIAQLVVAVCGPVGFLMTMTGQEREASAYIVLSAAVDVVLNVILIPRFGIMGAAFATATAVTLRSLLLSVRVRSTLGLTAHAFGKMLSRSSQAVVGHVNH